MSALVFASVLPLKSLADHTTVKVPSVRMILVGLSWAETKNDDYAVGDAGERSRWAITQGRWEHINRWRASIGYRAYSFSEAHHPEIAAVIAEDNLTLIRTEFFKRFHRNPNLLEYIARWRKPSTGLVTEITRQLHRRVTLKIKELS